MWRNLEGHDAIVDRFRRTIARGRLGNTYLFVGTAGVGKRQFALQLAQCLLCAERTDRALDACGSCRCCVLAQAGNHPDLHQVALLPGKNELTIDQFAGEKDHRHREGLCHDIAVKPMMGSRRIAIIDDADHLNQESGNSLLKTLEEPPPRSLIILVGTSPGKQLPTIRSRAQIVRFQPLSPRVIEALLTARGIVAEPEFARRLSTYCEGSLTRATELADPELWEFRGKLVGCLAISPLDAPATIRAVDQFVDAAGKEAVVRRGRLRTVIEFAADYYRALARRQLGDQLPVEPSLAEAVDQAIASGATDPLLTMRRLDRCLTALGHVARYANQRAVVLSWATDLSSGGSSQQAVREIRHAGGGG